jgi:hypothetical protein
MPPIVTPVAIVAASPRPKPLPKSAPVGQGKPKAPPSMLGDLSFEDKAALVLSLMPRTVTPGMIGDLCRQLMIVTANVYDIPLDEVLGRSREHIFSHPRSLAMAICVEVLGLSRPKAGWRFGGRDHTTVIQAVRKYGALIRMIEARRRP